jgi:hypothetical protein
MTRPEPEKDLPKPEEVPPAPDPSGPRDLTPEEREELRKKIEDAAGDDPNIYPVF